MDGPLILIANSSNKNRVLDYNYQLSNQVLFALLLDTYSRNTTAGDLMSFVLL